MDSSDIIPEKRRKIVNGFTNINVISLRYDWKINNFGVNGKANGKYIDSSTFSDSENSVCQWFLRTYPNGRRKEDDGCVSVFLHLKHHPNFKPTEVNYYFCIMDNEQNEMEKSPDDEYLFKTPSTGIGFSRFIKRDDLKKYLYADNLTIRCSLTAGINIENMQNQIIVTQKLQVESRLLQGFEKLFYNNKFSDVTIITQEKQFQAHKAILAAQSPVFSAMFENDMQEKVESIVELKDIDSDVLQEFLRFIYCGKIENLNSVAMDLFALADKYNVESLKVKCEEHFSKNLNVDNVLELIIVADRYNADVLKKNAIELFAVHVKELVDKDEYKSMRNLHPDTILEITKAMALR